MVRKHSESPWDDAQSSAVFSTAPKVSKTTTSPFGACTVFELRLI